MSRIRAKNTLPERIVIKLLKDFGCKYKLHDKKLPGKPDIIIKEARKLIFINGCFWHQHKGCKRQALPKTNKNYWLPKLKRNIEKQKADLKRLRKLGWKTAIIWECEAKNRKKLFSKLKKFLYEK